MTLFIAGIPLVLLLLFVYVFGGTLGAGLPGSGSDRGAYADYLAPGILLFTVAGGAQPTAIAVAMDMTEGIIARFRTMAIWRALGARRPRARQPDPDAAELVARARRRAADRLPPDRRARSTGSARSACCVLLTFALTWLSVGCGLVSQERRDRQQPADVPAAPAVPRQRLRPDRLDARRPALVRRPPAVHADQRDPARRCCSARRSAADAIAAVAWCAAITAVGYVWSLRLYARAPRSL